MSLIHEDSRARYQTRHHADDAPSSVVASDVHRALREEAVAKDAAQSALFPVAMFWQALTQGVCRVVDSFFTDTRCFVVTAGIRGDEPVLDGRRLQIVERILSGTPQKAVAMDLGLAPSTIALNARLGLRSLGVVCRPSRVHPLLMVAARAAHELDLGPLGSLSVVFPTGVALRAISIARPDASLAGVLPPAELAVIRSLVEGLGYKEIAAQRRTSERTTANQIGTVFRRLHVSGRNDLVHRLQTEGPIKTASVLAPVVPMPDWGPLHMAAS